MVLCSALCCCSAFCCFFNWDLPAHTQFAIAKWLYAGAWTITVILTWVLRDFASDDFARTVGQVAQFCGPAGDESSACSKGQIAMRISFANFCVFALHMVLTLGMTKENDWRVPLHSSGWALRLLIWIGALIGFFYVPSSAIYGYAQFARVGSGIFLVVQLLLLINWFYGINEWLTEKDNKWSWAALITGTVITFGLGIVCIGFAYYWYTADRSCHLNIFFTTWSLIVGMGLVGILFIPNKAPSAGLFTSGLVFLYCSFLLLSSLSSEPTDALEQCRRGGGANQRWVTIVGFCVAILSVIYSTADAGTSSSDLFGVKDTDGLDTVLPYRADFFHLVFALASLYIAMLFSSWQVSSSNEAFVIDKGWVSTWVKMASKWVCEILYAWSVVAPALFPNRDFGP